MAEGIDITSRDERVFGLIHDFGGVLRKDQIQQLDPEFRVVTIKALDNRLGNLYRHGYLGRPTDDEVKAYPASAGTYWLTWKSALHLARLRGLTIADPTTDSLKAQLRLSKTLAPLGILWRPTSLFKQLYHDLQVVDVHLSFALAVESHAHLQIETWRNDNYFRSLGRKAPYPDAYFVLTDTLDHPDLKARLLLEVDSPGRPHRLFIEDKVETGLAYLTGADYKQLSGANAGRWLEVIESDQRKNNLLAKTRIEAKGLAHVFLFATLRDVETKNPLTDPIWQRADTGSVQTLLAEK